MNTEHAQRRQVCGLSTEYSVLSTQYSHPIVRITPTSTSARSVPLPHHPSVLTRLATLLLLIALLSGCEEPPAPLTFTEVKRIDEKLSDAELQAFFDVAAQLPDGRLPPWPQAYVPLPDWNRARSLPVNELVGEELDRLEHGWSPKLIAQRLQSHRPLQRVLQRRRITAEQFAGLTQCLGAALSRSTVRESQNLPQLIERGAAVAEVLENDGRPFATLSREVQSDILRQTAWLTRADRADRLLKVPPENVELVRRHRERLAALLPAEFAANPLDGIADRLEEFGVPFDEAPGQTDAAINWDPARAIIGTDPPEANVSTSLETQL